MAEKFLGLDIGTASVKATLLSRGLRGGGFVADAAQVGIAEAGGIAGALQQLFSRPAFKGAICLLSLPASRFSFRNVILPFREEGKIRQTIAGAVEPLIRQPLDSALIDYTVVERGKFSKLFTAIAERELIDTYRKLLAPYVRETAAIDIGAVPLASFLLRRPDFPPCALILDIGREGSTAVFAGRGGILHVRHFYFGGEKATDAAALALGVEPEVAEEMKTKGKLPPEGEAAIGKALAPFFAELQHTALFLKEKGQIPEFPAKVIMTGGGARTPGIATGLGAVLAIPVEQSDLLSAGGFGSDEKILPFWSAALLDQSLALAARPLGKGTGFNFVQRERQMQGSIGELRLLLKKGAIAAGVIAVLGAVEFGLEDYGMRLRLERLRGDVIAEFKKIDPEATRIVDPVVQLKGKIAEAKRMTAGIADVSGANALVLFREIAATAPPEIKLSGLSLDEDTAAVKGEAPDFDSVEVFKKKLEGSKYIKNTNVGSTSLMKDGKGVEFNLKVSRKQ